MASDEGATKLSSRLERWLEFLFSALVLVSLASD